MYYCLYEIRNLLNDKIYVGVHKTKNLDDGYMGSGKVIRNAIKKYGSENFTKTILETFEDDASMYAREKEVVTEEFLAREDTYNLRRGGTGGFDYINKHRTTENRQKVNKITCSKGGTTSSSLLKERLKDDTYKTKWILSIINGQKLINHNYAQFEGKKHTEETKRRISEKCKLRTGDKNGSFGTCWIYNKLGNRKIKKDDLQQYLDAGYIKGRITVG